MIPGPLPTEKPLGKMTPYAFFVQMCRDEHKRTYPDEKVDFELFSMKCAERWKTMTDREKYSFQKMAEEDRKRYEANMSNYSTPPGGGGKMPKQRKKKDPNAPKRSMSAFFWFSQDERKKVRAENPKYGVGEVAKELGRRWADIDPTLKKKYEGLAEEDRKRYSQAKIDYKASLKGGTASSAAAAKSSNPSSAGGPPNGEGAELPPDDEADEELEEEPEDE